MVVVVEVEVLEGGAASRCGGGSPGWFATHSRGGGVDAAAIRSAGAMGSMVVMGVVTAVRTRAMAFVGL